MCDLFSINFHSPTVSIIKCQNAKGVQFVPGEHANIFKVVASIYKAAMSIHGIDGPVLVILAEDETKVKQRIAWEPKHDTLAGFCGPKENHVCISDYKPLVGVGDEGYNKIVDTFRLDKIGAFARVIVVNPLHASLPRLVLSLSCTCNCFDASWMRLHWKSIESLWIQYCEYDVGPVVGHASDGDSR
jgi:hypothetical protein